MDIQPLARLVVPVAMGWSVQGRPWMGYQLEYHLLAGAHSNARRVLSQWGCLLIFGLIGELSINHSQPFARNLGRIQML